MMEAVISGTLAEVLEHIQRNLYSYPRRVPGKLLIDGIELHYVDLHSFFFQANQIFAQRLYDFDTDNSHPFILDCGAHIGLASIYFASRYPLAKIKAYEADSDIARSLKLNCKNFGLPDFECIEAAVWSTDRGVRFKASADDSGEVHPEHGELIASVRLRDVLTEGPVVDLLKLDIEGAEFPVLYDCKGALGNVKKIIAELHCLSVDNSPAELLCFLEQEGFSYLLQDLHLATWLADGSKPPFPQFATDKYLITVYAWKK